MLIRKYAQADEDGWVRCRVLSFLDTPYFDNVLKEREEYENPAIELVAVEEGQIVGLLDIECEVREGSVCSRGTGLGGMLWHVAVHPDYRRRGVGNELLTEAEKIAKDQGLNRLEAWTRDDGRVHKWYEKHGFLKETSYFHVVIEGSQEIKGTLKSEMPKLCPIQVFAHYSGEDEEAVRGKFNRVHECFCYVKRIPLRKEDAQ
ncbi:GNAT family N-acetyltransferase [Shouchella shacheensis]|uniref:GNAT family N-acetyltransferase n=1 Tax=Shouchella shacheensis TaxID=1649580 RepID=UPI0007402B8D|nr:GNAT family N-acetyltransferase [Shouchella shacheensis]